MEHRISIEFSLSVGPDVIEIPVGRFAITNERVGTAAPVIIIEAKAVGGE